MRFCLENIKMKLGKLKPHEIEWNSLTPLSCVSIRTHFLVSISFESRRLCRRTRTRVYGYQKYQELYGSGLIAALNYCFQNIGGTTHKT